MTPPKSLSGLVPMRFRRSRSRSRLTPFSSNLCCKTGTNAEVKDGLLVCEEKRSSYASDGLDFVFRRRTGMGGSGDDIVWKLMMG